MSTSLASHIIKYNSNNTGFKRGTFNAQLYVQRKQNYINGTHELGCTWYVYSSTILLSRVVAVEDVSVQVPLAIQSLPDHNITTKQEYKINYDTRTWSHTHFKHIIAMKGSRKREKEQFPSIRIVRVPQVTMPVCCVLID